MSAELTRKELQQRALRGSFWSFALVAVSLPLGLLANAVIARKLQPLEYGELAALLVVYTVALQISDLGFVVAQTQWGVRAATSGDRNQVRRLLSQGIGYRLLVQFPVLAIVGLVTLRSSSGAAQLAWVAISFAALPLASVSMALLFHNRTATVGRISTLSTCFVQVGIVAVAVSADAAVAVLLARMALDLLGPALAARHVERSERAAALKPRWPAGMPHGFWRFAASSGVAVALQLMVYSRSEVFVFRIYDDAAAAGLFALAFGLSQQLTAGVDGLLAPLMPAVAGLVSAEPEQAWRGTKRALRLFSLLAGGVVALLPAAVMVVPVLFGPSYARSAPLLVPLVITAAFQSLTAPIVVLAYARRHGGTLVAANAAALGADLVLAFALIPVVGLWGGVVASVGARLLSIAILVRAALRVERVGLRALGREAHSWFLAVASLPAGFTAAVAADQIAGRAAGAVTGLVTMAIWFTALLRFTRRALHPEDADALFEVLPARAHRALGAGLRLVGVGAARG